MLGLICTNEYAEQVDSLIFEYEPFQKLWSTAFEFTMSQNEWMRGMCVTRLDHDKCENMVNLWASDSYKLTKEFDETGRNPSLEA